VHLKANLSLPAIQLLHERWVQKEGYHLQIFNPKFRHTIMQSMPKSNAVARRRQFAKNTREKLRIQHAPLTNPSIDSKTTTAIRIPYNWSL
jgi:hypothetical protein